MQPARSSIWQAADEACGRRPMSPAIRLLLAAFLAIICLGSRAAAAVEVVFIPSQDGKLQLPGHWFKATAAGPRPVVVTLHGCGGALDEKGNLNRSYTRDAGYFNDERMHVLVLESFTPRGETSICETPSSRRSIHEEQRRDDVFAAIQWLARQPTVDKDRIAVMGRSHGGSTVLSVLDRTDKAVQAQSIQPRAAIALYPGCAKFVRMWDYEISAPLLLLAGELDDWTPARECVKLHARLKRAHEDAPVDLVVYPGSHHGFDGVAPVQQRSNVGNTRSGSATVGGNPEAREKAHGRLFEFLSAQLGTPLLLTHEERFKGHRYLLPPASGFARIDDIAALPLNEKGHARYEHYLGLGPPKAFAITEKGGWHFRSNDARAMRTSMEPCRKANVKCWLYAVDDRVVWSPDSSARIDSARLQPNLP